MPTLLLQCVAPMQAWGTQSNFTVRDTGRDPSKSGIVGLLCAALGRPRTDTHTTRALDSLIMGVRVDREGQILRDFHTAGQGAADPYQGHLRADGESVSKGTIISNRYYLTDAMFLVGLTGEQELLETLQSALANPRWMLCLGPVSYTHLRRRARLTKPKSMPMSPTAPTALSLRGEDTCGINSSRCSARR